MKDSVATTLTVFLGCLLLSGCAAKSKPTTSGAKLPWSRVSDVEVATEAGRGAGSVEESTEPLSQAGVVPGASQSQVILAWGVPPYILDSKDDPERKIWQYPHTIVLFQGTRVEQVLPR